MTAVAHREIERKYEFPEGAEARVDWSALEGFTVSAEPVEHRMEAVYHDTQDMALGRRLVALRRRRGGADDGWHVKFHGPDGRHELQVPLLRTPERMPASVRNLLAGLTGGQELRPVATLRTARTVHMLSDGTGTEVAELAADDVEAVDERTGTARSWSEWEVELLDGTATEERQEQIFAAVEAVVRAAGGRPSTSRAKIARALGQEEGDAPAESGGQPQDGTKSQKSRKDKQGKKDKQGDKQGKKGTKGTKKTRKKKDESATAGGATGPDVLRAVLGALAEQLVLWDFKVRLDVPDAVHQMRVTSRSLRSVLRAARPFLEGSEAEELDAGLRELARTLSAARDAEVTAELLSGRVEALEGRVDPAAAVGLRRRAEEQARAAAARVRRHVAGREHLRLLADVRDVAAAPPLTGESTRLSGREVADALVERSLRKVVRVAGQDAAAEPAGGPDSGPDGGHRLEHLHDVRKAVKRVRYVDAVLDRTGHRPGKRLRRAAGDAEAYQDELGRVMDAAVVERWLADTAAALRRAGEDRYAVGALHGAEVVRLRAGAEGGADVVGVLLSQLREDLG